MQSANYLPYIQYLQDLFKKSGENWGEKAGFRKGNG